MLVRKTMVVAVAFAYLFLNLDGYWVGVAPNLKSPPHPFAVPTTDAPKNEQIIELSNFLRPYLGEELAAPLMMSAWDHGWPVQFYARDTQIVRGRTASGPDSLSSRWPIDAAPCLRFLIFWMLFDIAILVALASGLWFTIPRTLRFRCTFSLRFMLLMTSVLAVGFASGLFYVRIFWQLLAFLIVLAAVIYIAFSNIRITFIGIATWHRTMPDNNTLDRSR